MKRKDDERETLKKKTPEESHYPKPTKKNKKKGHYKIKTEKHVEIQYTHTQKRAGEKNRNRGGADEKNQPRNQSKDRRKNTGNREGVEDE